MHSSVRHIWYRCVSVAVCVSVVHRIVILTDGMSHTTLTNGSDRELFLSHANGRTTQDAQLSLLVAGRFFVRPCGADSRIPTTSDNSDKISRFVDGAAGRLVCFYTGQFHADPDLRFSSRPTRFPTNDTVSSDHTGGIHQSARTKSVCYQSTA